MLKWRSELLSKVWSWQAGISSYSREQVGMSWAESEHQNIIIVNKLVVFLDILYVFIDVLGSHGAEVAKLSGMFNSVLWVAYVLSKSLYTAEREAERCVLSQDEVSE